MAISHDTPVFLRRQEKYVGRVSGLKQLLLAEGHAVGALILSGVGLVGTHQDALQGAVVAGGGVVGALMDGAFDALVCVSHEKFLLFSWVRG